MRRYAVLFIGLLTGLQVVQARSQDPSRPSLDAGIKLVQNGAFEQGLLALDPVVRDLAGKPAESALLVRAHVYLGVAYVGLEQEAAARRQFKEAVDLDPKLQLAASEFSPRVLRVFEAARKGNNKTVLYGGAGIGLLGLGAVVAGGAAAVSVSQAAVDAPTPTPTPVPAPTPTPIPTPTATPTPAATCSLQLVVAPANAGCRIDVEINGVSAGSISDLAVFTAPCSARVVLFATNSAGPSATWSNRCGGSALGAPCVMNPLGTNSVVGLTCSR